MTNPFGGEPPAGATPQVDTEAQVAPVSAEPQQHPETAEAPREGLYGRLKAARENLAAVDKEVQEFLDIALGYDVANIGRKIHEQLPLNPRESSEDAPSDARLKTDDGRFVETKRVHSKETRQGFFVGADGRRISVAEFDNFQRYTAVDPNDAGAAKAAYECGATESSGEILLEDPEEVAVHLRMRADEISIHIDEDSIVDIYKDTRNGKARVVFNRTSEYVKDPLEIIRRAIRFTETATLKPVTSPATSVPPTTPTL